FPLSNWSELDVWQYVQLERIPVVPLYFGAERPVVERDGNLIVVDDHRYRLRPGEVPKPRRVRFRTLGCYPLSGAIESDAATVHEIDEQLLIRASKELVRLVTIGSVDDGKSTLIGRLLYETGALYEDQIAQVGRATRNGDPIDFSLFTDGLKAEREQGITIDVAYRYVGTA